MSALANYFLPSIGVTGLVLSGAVAFSNATRDRQELETATAAVEALRTRAEASESTVKELAANAAMVDDLTGKLENATAKVAELETTVSELAEVKAQLAAAQAKVTELENSAEANPEASAAAETPEEEPAAITETGEAEQPAEETTETVATPVLAGDPESGAKLFSKCKACHQVGPDAENKTGPHLNNTLGRVAGSIEGFRRYSKTMIKAGEEGLIWTPETLGNFLENPKGMIKRTKMSFRGFKDETDRADMIAFLQTYSEYSAAPPAVATDDAPEVELSAEILALVGNLEYGEYLASECLTCHKADGADDGIPSVTGWPKESFVIAMHAYKQKVRENPAMQLMAGKLSNDEIAALAAYFATLE